MREDFIQYIWQFQYFDKNNLQTTQKQPLVVLDKGVINRDAGADFDLARLLIDGVEWVGSIEFHVKASDWNKHHHTGDPAYNNVILHLVWEDDKVVYREDGSVLPTLALQSKVEISLLQNYERLNNSKAVVPCATQIETVPDLPKMLMLDRVMVERLERKALQIQEFLLRNQLDWEETVYQAMAQNFGFKTNAAPFLQLSRNLPCKIIRKHQDNLLQIEALVFGQAGFLGEVPEGDTYISQLQQEYLFLAQKYDLSPLSKHQWKFSKMRYYNFPTVRLAQWAAFLHRATNLFSLVFQQPAADLNQCLRTLPSAYWQRHYLPAKVAQKPLGAMGQASLEVIWINTVAPLWALFALTKDKPEWMDKAIGLLQGLPAENNQVTAIWDNLRWKVKTAFDSQALLTLYQNYCQSRKCLSCNIGVHLLKTK
jgi:hypothetical protein